jgi:5-methylcytosine-specific restriction protein A
MNRYAALWDGRSDVGRISIPERVRWEVWARDDFRCRRCGARERLSIDHIVAVVNGGSNETTNLQTLCVPCNSQKGTRPSQPPFNRAASAAELRKVRHHAEYAARMKRERDERIREAYTDSHTIRAIAHAAGISPSRVHQIIHGR